MITAMLYHFANRVEVVREGAPPLVFRNDDEPDLESFLAECQVGDLEDDKPRPGVRRVQYVKLDEKYLRKSWWQQERFQKFFRPDSRPVDFKRKPTRKTIIRRKTTTIPVFKTEETAPSHTEYVKVELPECSRCHKTFDPKAEVHATGLRDMCGHCSRDMGKAGPRVKRGQMIWAHKSVPILEIEGEKPVDPEELAKSRRR